MVSQKLILFYVKPLLICVRKTAVLIECYLMKANNITYKRFLTVQILEILFLVLQISILSVQATADSLRMVLSVEDKLEG